MRATKDGVVRAAPGDTPDAGTGLFATCRIPALQPVLEMDTWLSVLDSARLEDTCTNCFGVKTLPDREVDGAPEVTLKLCSGCKTVRYCTKACQSQDWGSIHKYECKIFKPLHPNVLPTSSRAVMRLVLFKRHFKDDKRVQMFDSLKSHISEVIKSKPNHLEKQALSARAVREYSKSDLSLQEITELFSKLDINACTLTSPFYDHMGIAAEPLVALCNHSCSPNAAVDFDKGKIWLRAKKDIEKGEQIFISYIDPLDAYAHRQSELFQRYYFHCRCARCQKEKDLPLGPLLKDATLSDMRNVQIAKREADELFAMAKSANSPIISIRYLRQAMSVLRKTSIWPITYRPYDKLRDELISVLIDARQFQSAFVQCAIRYLCVDPVIYSKEWNSIASMHKWVFAKLTRHLSMAGELGIAEGLDLSKYDLNLFIIIYAITLDLERTAPNELPTVEDIYKGFYATFTGIGWTPEDLRDDVNEQMSKLERLVDDALQVNEASI